MYNLDYPKNKINFHFVINDSIDCSKDILLRFKNKHKFEYNNIYIDTYNRNVPDDERIFNVRSEHTYQHLSILKNYIMSKTTTDYLMFVDSDVLVPKASLKQLLQHKKSVISGLIYNGYLQDPIKPYRYTNIMKYENDGVLRHISNYYTKHASNLKSPKLLRVDVTGAFILIHKDVYNFAQYSWHLQGEDVSFCDEVRKAGHDIYCDVSVFGHHIMRKDQI